MISYWPAGTLHVPEMIFQVRFSAPNESIALYQKRVIQSELELSDMGTTRP
jgi:hypothetical protein